VNTLTAENQQLMAQITEAFDMIAVRDLCEARENGQTRPRAEDGEDFQARERLVSMGKMVQSNNKKKQKKIYGLLRESLDLQNNQKSLGFLNIQHVYSFSRITLK
jgi:hypothetical protein